MALYLSVFITIFSFWNPVYSVSGTLLEASERPPCNQTLASLQELQEASLNAVTQSPDYVLCVDLQSNRPAAPQYISYVDKDIAYSSVIITGNGSVVKCEKPSSELSLNDYSQFPLIFSNSSLVVIEGVSFEGCMRPIQFKWVRRVELTSTNFSDFYPGGAVEISNCPQVIVSSCQFTNNTSLGIGRERYSGNAGAVAIGYNDSPRPPNLKDDLPIILISESTFENNNATAAEAFQYDVSEVLSQRLYNQRGGAIACYFGTPDYSATVEIIESTIKDSFSRDSGGGVYIFLAGSDNAHTVNIQDTDFIGNEAQDGGGLEITQATPNSLTTPNNVTLTNCNFVRNIGNFGGGFKSIQLDTHGNMNNVTVKNTTFSENRAPVGSGLYLQSTYAIDKVKLEKRIVVEDCTFTDNVAKRGALFVIRNTVGIQGNTEFKRNIGPALRVVGGLTILGGNILFLENRHNPDGFSGALHLSSFGQITLQRGSNISFVNNSGSEGASIVVIGQLISAGFKEQLYNPQCFMQYEYPRIPPPSWEVSMTFKGNRAAIGPVIYASDVDVCEWFDASSPFFEEIQESWTFMDLRDNYILRESDQLDVPDYYIQTVAHTIRLAENEIISAAPGDNIVVNVVALDEFRHNTTAFLELSPIQDIGMHQVMFSPSIVQTVAGVGQIEFTYFSSILSANTSISLTATFLTERETSAKLTLSHDLCLPGYFLKNQECVCEETGTVVLCDPTRKSILLANGLWGASQGWSKELVTHVCPPGYCNCTRGFDNTTEEDGCLLEYENPFAICHYTRTGLLCGECRPGYGVGLLTNECKKFTDVVPQFWLFPIYFAVLIPLLVVIVRFGVHLPTILRGFIFYIQISPIAVEFLPQNFRLRVDVMSCLSSTLALYVPYDFNFHQEMTSLESYGLRYVTPLVALIAVPIAARIGRRRHTKYWHGVWTIIQVMYIMAVHTSVSLLLCPTLTRTTSTEISKVTLWFYDGSVQCYRGWHILLAIIALLSLLALGLVIPLVAASLHFKFIRRKIHVQALEKLEPFSLSMTKGLKDKYYWWPVVDLACRYFFVIIVVCTVGNKTVSLLLSLMLFIIQFYTHPYDNAIANYTESFVLFVLVVLLGFGSTTAFVRTSKIHSNFTFWPLFYLPVVVGVIVATTYILYQTWVWMKANHKFDFLVKKTKQSKRAQTLLRRFTVSRRTWLVHSETFTQSEVSIFDERRKTVVNDTK